MWACMPDIILQHPGCPSGLCLVGVFRQACVAACLLSAQDTVSIILFNVLPQLIDILVACTYLASALKGPWVALIVLFTVGSYVPLTLLITEQRGKVRAASNCLHCASVAEHSIGCSYQCRHG